MIYTNIYERDYFATSVWDESARLEAYAKREKRLRESKGTLNTAAAWRNNDFGCADCTGTSWEAIIDAYNDARMTKMAMGYYADSNHVCY